METNEHMDGDSVRLTRLYGALPASLLGSVALTVLLTLVFWEVAPREALWSWVVAMGGVTGFRFLSWLAFRGRALAHSPRLWWGWYLTGVMAAGAVWGWAAHALFPADPVHQGLLVLVVGGVAASAAVSMAAAPWAFWGFAALAVGPLLGRLAGTSVGLEMTLVLALFLVVLGDVVWRQHRQVRALDDLQGLLAERQQGLQEKSAALARQARVQAVLDALVEEDNPFERLRRMLAVGAEVLRFDGAHVGAVQGARYWIHQVVGEAPGLGPGVNLPLEETCYARLEAAGGTLFWIRDEAAGPGLPGVRAIFATRVEVEGRVFVLVFHSAAVRPAPTPEDELILANLGRWLRSEMGARLARDRLRDSESRLRLLLDSVGEGVYGVDREGRITFINEEGLRALGYARPEALVGRSAHEAFHHRYPDGRPYPEAACPLSLAFREGRAQNGEGEWFWRADGSAFPVEYTTRPLRRGGSLEGAVVVFRDISERREVERRQSEFVASVSHELRTPLTAILASLDLVLNGTLGELPEQARLLLEKARANGERLAELVDDLLAMDQIQSGRLHLELQEVAVQEVLAEALEKRRESARRQGVELVCQAPSAPLRVRADRTRLLQVLDHLLSNAIKFSHAGGVVRLEAKAAPGGVELRVRDFGEGIPEAFRERLFQRFTQADASSRRRKGGTGLGLAITHALVTRMNGHIDFDSKVGEGSCFRVRLPAA